MSWLCRIGLHKWRLIYRRMPFGFVQVFLAPVLAGPGWYPIGKKCRRCSKRRYG